MVKQHQTPFSRPPPDVLHCPTWAMLRVHTFWVVRETGASFSWTRCHPPSRMSQSHPRSAQNTCEATSLCEWRSVLRQRHAWGQSDSLNGRRNKNITKVRSKQMEVWNTRVSVFWVYGKRKKMVFLVFLIVMRSGIIMCMGVTPRGGGKGDCYMSQVHFIP